jgi:hypothetical protein
MRTVRVDQADPNLVRRLVSGLLTICAISALAIVVAPTGAGAATAPVSLGRAANFAVLAASTVTNTGPTTVTGDLGLSPGTAVTGFPPGAVDGTVHIADANAAAAKSDLAAAFEEVAARPATATIPVELGGTTETAGVYDSPAGTFGITGTVTLDGEGDPNAVFIFKAASTLITASASTVRLINGAQSCNVFWQVGSSATLGTYSTLRGNVMALASTTVTTGVIVDGRILARNAAVTLDTATVTRPMCAQAPIRTTTTLTSSVNPVGPNMPLTLTATVLAQTPGVHPVGLVVFVDGDLTIVDYAPLDSTGQAMITTSTLPVGIHWLTAYFLSPTQFSNSVSSTYVQFVLAPHPAVLSPPTPAAAPGPAQ